jgi:hypothetical protein
MIVLVALIVGGLIAAARGRAHHRGDEVGAAGSTAVTTSDG